MNQQLRNVIKGNHDTSHILPFFWQHGEDRQTLRAEMDAIRKSGITQFCVESRTHEKFCEEEWWEDFGFILAYAKENGMKVWLLDDKHFPTGYACGYVASHPELRQVTLTRQYYDFVGGTGRIMIQTPVIASDESFYKILAYKRSDDGRILVGDAYDLTDTFENGFITADFPAGVYRVFYLIRSQNRHNKKDYIDMLNPRSTEAMLTAVYEPHYAHFKDLFGDPLIGFFSDEPEFTNDRSGYDSYLKNGMKTLPWRDDLPLLMAKECSLSADEITLALPALWQEVGDKTPAVRNAYMETITKLYRENFSEKLGSWCRERGVMYIGHIIEDMGSHLRLTYGPGHFFRSLDGQDMAGCDIVLNQTIPGLLEMPHAAPIWNDTSNPAFYSYLLAKLASSHAHIDPKKKGRAMCEIFGAFGWAEGLPMMKYLTDQMLSAGINYFVPHAFTPKKDDPDCPPHFYNHGTNREFPMFGQLMTYMHRLSDLLFGGIHQADVAVLYSTAEWTGAAHADTEEVTKVLTQKQIDFDVIPYDYLENSRVLDKKLVVNREKYGALIVPYGACISDKLLRLLEKLAGKGLSVIFEDALPSITDSKKAVEKGLFEVVSLGKLASYLKKRGFYHVSFGSDLPHVRFYHTVKNGSDFIFLFNEDPLETADFTFKADGDFLFYDAMTNELTAPSKRKNGVRVKLRPFESVLLVSSDGKEYDPHDYGEGKILPVMLSEIPNAPDGDKYYRAKLPKADGKAVLSLGRVGECARVFVNGRHSADLIAPPFEADLSGLLDRDVNELVVRVVTSEAFRHTDRFSAYLPVTPPGISGDAFIRLRKTKKS